jgi:FtsH-binding integral membrane protein
MMFKDGYAGVSSKVGEEVNLESGETLYPGLSYGENQLRWGFIRKVYGILAAQLVLTTLVSFVTVLYSPINDLLRGNSGLLLFLMFLPLICT